MMQQFYQNVSFYVFWNSIHIHWVYLYRHKRGGGTTNSGYAALKILGKHDVIRLKQVEHVKNERQILSDIKVLTLSLSF